MFVPTGYIGGGDHPVTKDVIIDNSDAIRAYDAVKLLNGNLEAVAAGNSVFGIVISIHDKFGNALSPEKVSLSKEGTATIDDTTLPNAVTVASDNETVDLVTARISLSIEAEFLANANAAPGTTVASDKPGTYIDVTDQRILDESSATRTLTSGGQFYGWGTDPAVSGNYILCSIHESEFYGFGKVIG